MADGFSQYNSNPGRYFYQQPQPHSDTARGQIQRNSSPLNSHPRALLAASLDVPSPDRSPGARSPAAYTTTTMYNHNSHRQNHGLMNGNTAHQGYQGQMNLAKHFNQNHGHQAHHMNNQHQDHGGHQGGYGNHQHSVSASTLSNNTPHFTPAHLQQQNGTPGSSNSLGKPVSEYHALQLAEYEKLKSAGERPHYYARTAPHVNRMPNGTPSLGNSKLDGEDRMERRRATDEPEEENAWKAIDFGGQGLKCMSTSLFRYDFLKKIFFNHNKLSWLPGQIGEMRNLTVLDLSFNELYQLPPEIGMLTNLKRLLLFENKLSDLPYEVGSLYQLDILGLEGNPMRHDYVERLNEKGTQDLIRYLREQADPPTPPEPRQYISLDDPDGAEADRFSVFSWNILCDRASTPAAYGYAPSEALQWSRRRGVIMDEVRARNADIICLQEVDVESYAEYFRPDLANDDYRGVYWPKGRAQTMSERESRNVDGCATFYRNAKYILLDKQQIVFSRTAINRPDMKGEHDFYNRVMPRDHIATVTFLENRKTGSRLMVVNVHLAWEPHLRDVKIIQVAIMMEQLVKLAETYAKWPACTDKEVFRFANQDPVDGVEPVAAELAPSMKYDDGTQIPMLICSDMNSTLESGVHEFVTQGVLSKTHPDLGSYTYGDFTRNGMSHPFSLKSSYSLIGELPFTNYTPDFKNTIDYIWFSTNSMQVVGLLGEIDPDYMRRVPGFPDFNFPSDHISLWAEFVVKSRKERKQVEADFGPSSRRINNR